MTAFNVTAKFLGRCQLRFGWVRIKDRDLRWQLFGVVVLEMTFIHVEVMKSLKTPKFSFREKSFAKLLDKIIQVFMLGIRDVFIIHHVPEDMPRLASVQDGIGRFQSV